MTSLANSLAGLSLLSGTNFGGIAPAATVESRAVRAARAQFTLPAVAPIWRQARPSPSAASLVHQPSLIDRSGGAGLPADVATAFTAYKALERLRALADAGSRGTLDGGALQQRFASGLVELEQWIAAAPGNQLALSFGRASRRAESIALPAATPADLRGSVVVAQRDLPIEGLTGTEHFSLRISRPGASDIVSVDLSATPQPPKLDTVAAALNQAIAAIPTIGADGAPVLDSGGTAVPRYQSRFAVVRSESGGWGLELRSGGIETVSLRDADARPALMVAESQAAGAATLSRLELPADLLRRATLGEVAATDRAASAVQPPLKDGTAPAPILAPLSLGSAVTDADGATYAVGTSSGSLGAVAGDGSDDLLLVKLDSLGRQVWQRNLGTAGTAEGLSIALAPAGGVTVGGTLRRQGPDSDGDLLVARFGGDGEELMLAEIRQIGDESLQGMAVLGDGGMVVGARSAVGSLSLTRLDAVGKVTERLALATDAGSQIRGLAIAPDGDLLLLTQSGADAQLRRYAGGSFAAPPSSTALAGLTASALAVAGDGRIAIGGRRSGEGAVALLDRGAVAWASLAGSGEERIDHLLFSGDDLFAAGRTSGSLGAPRTGLSDAFVARIDAASGAVEQVQQWGRAGAEVGAVAMALAPQGDSKVHRLGFNDGVLNPPQSPGLADQTALRPGDSFLVSVNGGPARTVSITADESAADFAERVGRLIGRAAGRVTVARADGSPRLRFEPQPGQRIDLRSGPAGQDALAKLGLPPGQLIAPPPFDSKAPRVRPGGHYGLDLAPGLSLRDKAASRQSLDRIDNAIATVRAGFRSLYWDETKAALAEGPQRGGKVSPYLAGQLARYRDALSRLGG